MKEFKDEELQFTITNIIAERSLTGNTKYFATCNDIRSTELSVSIYNQNPITKDELRQLFINDYREYIKRYSNNEKFNSSKISVGQVI